MNDKRFAMAIWKPLGELRPHAGNKIRKDQSLFDQRRQAGMGGAAAARTGEASGWITTSAASMRASCTTQVPYAGKATVVP